MTYHRTPWLSCPVGAELVTQLLQMASSTITNGVNTSNPPHLPKYCMLLRIKSLWESMLDDFDIDPYHPKCGSHVQRLACSEP